MRRRDLEAEVISEIRALTGFHIRDKAWPFFLLFKAGPFDPKWRAAARGEARIRERHPAIVFNVGPEVRVSVPLGVIGKAVGGQWGDTTEWADLNVDGFAYVAREILGGEA